MSRMVHHMFIKSDIGDIFILWIKVAYDVKMFMMMMMMTIPAEIVQTYSLLRKVWVLWSHKRDFHLIFPF